MKIIPARCPYCLSPPEHEGKTGTLYRCGTIVSNDSADLMGDHCKKVSAKEKRLVE